MTEKVTAIGLHDGLMVFCLVTDLNEFIQADTNSPVFVEDEHGNQSSVRKGEVTWVTFERAAPL